MVCREPFCLNNNFQSFPGMKHYLIVSILNLIFHFGAISLHSQTAERILTKSISAVGGEKAIEKAKSLRAVYRGISNLSAVHQGANPQIDEFTWRQETLLMDLDNNVSCFREESGQTSGTYSAWQEVLKDGKGVRINLKTRKSIPVSEPVFQGNHKNNMWRIPHLVLKELSEHIHKVKPIGIQKRGGRTCFLLEYQQDSFVVMNIFIDSLNGLPMGYEYVTEDQTGQITVQYLFKKYQSTAELGLYPSGFKVIIENRVYRDMTLFDVRHTTRILQSPWFGELNNEFAPVSRITYQKPTVEKIGMNGWLFRNIIGYNVLVYDLGGGLAIVDAPASFPLRVPLKTNDLVKNGIDVLENEINRIWPGKKISYIIPTHHHQDHFGGIRPICEKGVSIITTAGNLKLTQNLCPSSSVLTVKDSLVLGKGEDPLIIYNFKTLHSGEILFAYLPGSKSVFEADLSDYVLTSKQFLKFMEKKRLVVEWVYGSHNSGVATPYDLEEDDPSN